jgi:hypothetical protein
MPDKVRPRWPLTGADHQLMTMVPFIPFFA